VVDWSGYGRMGCSYTFTIALTKVGYWEFEVEQRLLKMV